MCFDYGWVTFTPCAIHLVGTATLILGAGDMRFEVQPRYSKLLMAKNYKLYSLMLVGAIISGL